MESKYGDGEELLEYVIRARADGTLPGSIRHVRNLYTADFIWLIIKIGLLNTVWTIPVWLAIYLLSNTLPTIILYALSIMGYLVTLAITAHLPAIRRGIADLAMRLHLLEALRNVQNIPR